MMTLVLKEFRQLRPIAWLWVAVLVFAHATELLTVRLDETTFGSWCAGYCDPGNGPLAAGVSILFTLITAYALFPREHDESTIDFLRALPVRRAHVYLAKVVAACLLLIVINLLSYGIDALVLASNPESLGGRFLGQVWWTLLWRDCLFAFVILAHGVVLSWFRITGLIVYAVYVLLLMWYESTAGSAGLLSVFGILANDYDGQRLVVDATAIVVHVGIACALLLLGERLWSRTASARSGGAASVRSRRGRLLLGVAGFVALAAVALYRVSAGNGALPDSELAVIETAHYRFVYDTADVRTVAYLVEHADTDLAAVAAFLGVEDIPFIRVDLSAASEHAAGLAAWKKIRMDLDTFEDDISQRRVLAHELVHVLQATESDRALGRQFATSRFFIEGMAQHVSFEAVPEPARRAANEALAAVARARQDIRFVHLADAVSFGERFDPELYYSLGDTWSQAMAEVCGDASLGDFLRAAGREEASREIGGELFWRDTFREIGCELDAVNSVWAVRMDAAYSRIDRARFPVFDDIVMTRDDSAGVVRLSARLVPPPATVTGAAGEDAGAASGAGATIRPERVVVRIRANGAFGTGVDPVFPGTLEADGTGFRVRYAIPVRAVPKSRFDFQVGYAPGTADAENDVDSRVYYDGWRGGSAP